MVVAFSSIFLTFPMSCSFLILIIDNGIAWNVALDGRSTLLLCTITTKEEFVLRPPPWTLMTNHFPLFRHLPTRTSTSMFPYPWTTKCPQIRPMTQYTLLDLSLLQKPYRVLRKNWISSWCVFATIQTK